MATKHSRRFHDWFPGNRVVPIAALSTGAGTTVRVGLDSGSLQAAVDARRVDAYIVASETGFSPLDASQPFISEELGVSRDEINRRADWNRYENSRVTLIALPSRNPHSRLRGVVLAPAETSLCYKPLALPIYGRPYRDFFYNITYEAVAWAVEKWGARKVALSHLSAGTKFHADIATCNAEAVAHYCDAHPGALDAFWFLGCCISPAHLKGIQELNRESTSAGHRTITTQVEERPGYQLVHLDWKSVDECVGAGHRPAGGA